MRAGLDGGEAEGWGGSHLPQSLRAAVGLSPQLQEQLNRFMTVNENLRRKVDVVQAQLRSALERKGEAEALWEAERRGRAAGPARTSTPTVRGAGQVPGGRAKGAQGPCNTEEPGPPSTRLNKSPVDNYSGCSSLAR